MGDEKRAAGQAAQPISPDAPGHHGTNDEDGGGNETIPNATPPDGDGN